MNRLFVFLLTVTLFFPVNAGEGLWSLLLLDSLNYRDMKEKGLHLRPEEIYSINQASLKDAVVIFGGGCTGEIISPDGLVITNHHCGYSRIQVHSTVENNYLANGFWAGSKSEELPNPGLSVTFLIRIENVTEKVLQDTPDSLPENERNKRVAIRASDLQQKAVAGTHYQAEIKSFYFGREYYLFVYEVFNDVRLVGAPPESIGRFGGDTDNWIWPRHTGDFSLFRIYANKDNKPAAYSPDNVPYKPRKYLYISADGVSEGDFTMVLGYPGRTDEYLTADALRMIAQKSLPAKIEMRTLRLNMLQEEMASGSQAKLIYSGRYVNVSNAWKKWIGVTKGVEHSGALKKKVLLEQRFDKWAGNLDHDPEGYSSLMSEFKNTYALYEPIFLSNDLGNELMNSVETFNILNKVQSEFYSMLDSSENYKKAALQMMKKTGRNFFKTNATIIDHAILPSLLKIYADNTAPGYHPPFYGQISANFKGSYESYIDDVFKRSIFTDSSRYIRLLNKSAETIRKGMITDPLVTMYRDFSRTLMFEVYRQSDSLNLEINGLYRKYLSGLKAMDTSRIFYPDANFTMRLSYGKVEGYKPSDAVDYLYFSTLDGILEKEDPDIADYKMPDKLKDIYKQNDFGTYTVNGKVPVCFIASNHTSGGNSGSPVLNADGNLIGINFDRNWEGTVSDYAYDPAICRNISLDIRYVLFIIDKVAGANWLFKELTILKN